MILKHQHFDLLQKTVLERMVFNPPLKANGSMHDEACFLYVVNGNSTLYGPTKKDSLQTNEGVVMKCGSYLNSWSKNENDSPSEAVAIHFYPEVLKHVYQDKIPDFLVQKKPQTSKNVEKVQIDQMIKTFVDSLLFYFENPSLINEELIILKVKELILLLVNTDNSDRIRSILQDLFNPEEYQFKDIIQTNLFEDLSIDDLAVLTSMSVSSFKRKFKEVFDDSPAHYIKSRRLEKAAELLLISQSRVTDICYDCGFSDIGHFSKSFAAKYGKSPSEYREKQLS
ncbi:helix-turn-helix domain-containing protein [Sediminitomix flava]|uniref:AraC family transcriptional regulator n=1 Tax=Sediminitomix flava TaxID=379075 RepID=A0A315ZB49_SEDFL|nr:AraC family transcriptional regulator [Sediminitomix flava]PWJ42771.1 AraC family transcriptional regulator [Sediminitomix flava]